MNTEKIEKINQINLENSYLKNKDFVLDTINDEDIFQYFYESIKDKKFTNIVDIEFIFEEFLKKDNLFLIFNILENNLSEPTIDFIITFIKKHYNAFIVRDPYHTIYAGFAIKILKRILSANLEYVDGIYDIVADLIKVPQEDIAGHKTSEQSRKDIARILLQIFKQYVDSKNTDKINEIVDLAKTQFDLVNDESGYAHYTPSEIFDILRQYIEIDFKSNFKDVIDTIVAQYNLFYSGHFKGWELSGGGISQSGNRFSAHDRKFVVSILAPSIEYFYNGDSTEENEKKWQEIVSSFVTRDEQNVSLERPDFLNRSTIYLLFKRYQEFTDERREEAFNILKDFILMGKGIPPKYDLIYQMVNIAKISNDEKWRFIQVGLNAPWNSAKTPLNVFFEQIVSSLARDKYEPAIELIDSWFKSKEYTDNTSHIWGHHAPANILALLNSDDEGIREKGISLFIQYITSDGFVNRLDRFDTFSIANLLSTIFSINFDRGLSILKDINNNENLSVTQQLLVFSGLNKVEGIENKVKIFYDFLAPLFMSYGKVESISDIKDQIAIKICKRFEERLTDSYARTAIVELGEELAKNKKFDEALVIARIFINDPNPELDDDYHKRIIEGKEGGSTFSISAVRGWVAYLLSHFPVIGGAPYMTEVISMVEKLSSDPNYYIRYMVSFPLMNLAQSRHTVIAVGSTERFMTLENAKKVEEIAFSMLRNTENQNYKAIMVGVMRVFNNIRNLNTETALEVLSKLEDIEDEDGSQVLVALYIFYAEFRKNSFESPMWQKPEFEYLKNFDQSKIQERLNEILVNGNDRLRSNFAFKFANLQQERADKSDGDFLFEISLKYFKKLIKKYTSSVFDDVFRFIQENIKEKYEPCFDLLKEAVSIQKETLQKVNDDPWRSLASYYLNEISSALLANNPDDFLMIVEQLAQYPATLPIITELKEIANDLLKFDAGNKKVETIFNHLEEKDPSFHLLKEKWLKGIPS